MPSFVRKLFCLRYFTLIGSVGLFVALVYLKYPLFLDKIHEEFGYFHAHVNKKELNTANYKFSYVERGDGQAILFVHGFRSDKNNWLGYIRKLGGGYKYVALDLPYHGSTVVKRKVEFNIKNMTAALDEFIKAKKLNNFYMVSTSLGAGFALEYARHNPDKVLKIVLINPFALKPSSKEKLRAVVEKNKKVFSPDTLEQLDYLFVSMKGFPLQVPSNIKNYILEKIRATNAQGKKMLEEVSCSEGLEKYLPRIRIPVLILQGSKDQVINFKDKHVYKKLLPNLKYVEIKGGHHIFYKKSLRKAVLEIKKFLAD